MADDSRIALLKSGEDRHDTKHNKTSSSIIDYLDQYCDNQNNFDFAVMLKGPWGVGKTHFIQRYITSKNSESAKGRFMYVSLYGVSSPSQIDDEIFRQLHPILSSKPVQFGSQIMKGLLRGAVKIDLDLKDSASIDIQTPSIDIREFLKKAIDRVIIFDDLERCSVKMSDILEYINVFVEHQKQKVLIIANENELIEREKQDPKSNRYNEIKEKVVGRTLEIQLDVSAVLPEFVSNIRHDRARRLFEDLTKDVEAIFTQSKTQNLRLLKQSLWDFEFLCASFKDRHTEQDVTRTIMRVVLALSFEYRSSRLRREEMAEIQVNRLSRMLRADKGDKTLIEELEARYPEVEFDQTFIGSTELTALLFDGRVEANSIQTSLVQSLPFASPNLEPAWKRIANIFATEPREFDEAVSEMESQFTRRGLIIPGEIFHMFGLSLFLSKIGIIKRSKEAIINECELYIRDLKAKNMLVDLYVDDVEDIWMMNAYGGYTFTNQASRPEFQKIKQFYQKELKAYALSKLPAHGQELLILMQTNPTRFLRQLCLNSFEKSPYHNVPVLAAIAPERFVASILDLNPELSKDSICDVEI